MRFWGMAHSKGGMRQFHLDFLKTNYIFRNLQVLMLRSSDTLRM